MSHASFPFPHSKLDTLHLCLQLTKHKVGWAIPQANFVIGAGGGPEVPFGM